MMSDTLVNVGCVRGVVLLFMCYRGSVRQPHDSIKPTRWQAVFQCLISKLSENLGCLRPPTHRYLANDVSFLVPADWTGIDILDSRPTRSKVPAMANYSNTF